jgi:Zn-dependent protease with chaperone function
MTGRNPFVARPVAALVVALMLTPGLAIAQTKVKAGFNLFSPEQDVQVGQQSAAEAEQQLPMVNNAAVESYVNNIGRRLAQNAGGPNFQYRFRVVNASDINAFALPGGYIYVNRGVLDQARNEGEVAGVLAHEIAHVALRHGTHQASKAYAAQAGLSILGGLLGGKVGSGAADIINAVGGFGLNALFLKYSRDLETQADIRGAQILAASGYSPADMVNFFHTLERVDSSKKTNWLSDHPAPPDRIARIQKEQQMLKVSANPTTNVAQLQNVQSQLRGMGAAPTMQQIAQGTAAQQTQQGRTRTSRGSGTTSVNVDPPSTSMATFTSPSGLYRVSYPSNWQVYEQGSTGVTIAPRGGVGQVSNGSTDVVYGVVINHYEPFNSGGQRYLNGVGGRSSATLEDATNDLLNTLVQNSGYLRVVSGSGQRMNVAGGSALAARMTGTDPATGINERVTVVTRQLGDEHLVYMLFITPEAEASRYSTVLNSMVRSIQVSSRH